MAQEFLLQKSQINDLPEKICYNLEKGGNMMEKHITLFTDILPEEQERMRVCFHAREDIFRNGETIMEYSRSMNKIGLILYMIDELKKDAVFGEPFLLPADSQHYYVTAEEETKVMFIDYDHVIKRCEKACHHHSQMVSNLLQMAAMQSRQQMERIYVLSRTTTKKKLLAYLNNLSSQTHSHSVQIPMSYTALAQYLTVDRSAMTRELKNLEKEGILTKKGRNIRLRE